MPKNQGKIPPISTLDEFKSVVDEIAIQSREYDQIALRQEQAIARIRKRFAEKLAPFKQEIDARFKRATKFAVLKREELIPRGLKSSCTALAEFGFRLGKPALCVTGDFTWDDVKEAIGVRLGDLERRLSMALGRNIHPDAEEIQEELNKWQSLLVTTTEPVKENIKALLTEKERATIYTEIRQGETFWVEAKKEKEAKPVEAAA